MFEAYAIGVRISLINHASAGLLALSRAFLNTEKDAAALQKRMASIQSLALKGGALLGAGAAGLSAIGKMVKPASEYAHQLQLMNTAGMKHLEIVQATQAAWSAAKGMPTATAAENLAAIRELRMVFGSTSEAIQYMPTVQKMQAVLSNLLGSNAGDQAYTVAKALEMKGAVANPQLFAAQADAITKAMVASGGKVTASDFLSAFKYGRAATTGWNDEFAYTILPTLIQEMKSSGGSGGSGGPGNALMSMYSAVVGGTIPQKSLRVWEKLGLLDPSKIVWTKTHSAKGVEPGGILGSGEFQANPFAWTQDVLLPALKRAGYTTPEKQKEALQYLFPNRTAGFMATQMVEQPWKFKRDQGLIGQASGINAYNQLLKTDPEMAEQALQSQWKNLQAQLAFTILPQLISAFTWLTGMLTDLTNWSRKHATATKVLMWAFIGLSGAMTIGGSVMLLTAAFRGLGLALAFQTVGGYAGLLRMAKGLTAFSKAMLLSNAGGLAGIAKTTGALRTFGATLGWLGGVAIAAYAGMKIGQAASNALDKSASKDAGEKTFGSYLFDRYHPFNPATGKREWSPWQGMWATGESISANNALEQNYHRIYSRDQHRWLSPQEAQAIQVHTTINVDGQAIATAVTDHQVKQATRPQTGMSAFDSSMFPTAVGLNYGH